METYYPYPASSGLWTTPTDLVIAFMEIMDAQRGNSKTGLSAESAKELITPQGDAKWAGLGVFLDGSGLKAEFSSLGWGVGFQCLIAVYPHLAKGMAIMTNTDSGIHQLEGLIGEIYRDLAL